MKKTLLAILSALLVITTVQPVQANDQKVLAILDTAINSNNFPQIIHEVCFTTVKSAVPSQNMSCPNGELFMEGKGAASAPWPTSINNAIYHGDAMVKSALTVDSNIKIVFIRIANVTSLGNQSVPADGRTILSAMNWVSNNASKYSIDAVSISQSGVSTDLKTGTKSFHSQCGNPEFANAVSQLSSVSVPVFAATGNDGLSHLVGFPACVPGVNGVGALANTVSGPFSSATQLEKATNKGPGLDMTAPGKVRITKYNGSPTDTAGSSVATAVSAASYVGRNTFRNFGEYLSSLSKITIGTASYIRN